MVSSLAIICDPLIDLHGPGNVALLLARFLRDSFDTEIVAPMISPRVDTKLTEYGISATSLEERYIAGTSSLAFAEAWFRETFLLRNAFLWRQKRNRPDMVVNISNTFIAQSDVWYMQGPVGQAIRDIAHNMPMIQRLGAVLFSPILDMMDSKQIRLSSGLSSLHVAGSYYCGASYSPWNVRVDKVIYPPLDTSIFCSSTRNPTEDYCLAYLGKETHFQPIIGVANAGIDILAFGSKLDKLPPQLQHHPRIQQLGLVSDSNLVNLYSHARFTLFPFTVEPFGYVPVESMACSTPVLTYNKQGPSETVVNGETGWTAANSEELVQKAVQIWKTESIAKEMRIACRNQALRFSVTVIGEE